MNSHFQRLSLRPPFSSPIAEIPHQFLLFRVHRDHRLTTLLEGDGLIVDVLELGVSVGMGCSFPRFAIGLQTVPCLSQQPGHRHVAYRPDPADSTPPPICGCSCRSNAMASEGRPASPARPMPPRLSATAVRVPSTASVRCRADESGEVRFRRRPTAIPELPNESCCETGRLRRQPHLPRPTPTTTLRWQPTGVVLVRPIPAQEPKFPVNRFNNSCIRHTALMAAMPL